MRGPSMLKGTWLVLVVATMPLVASQMATAAPGYPVANPPDMPYTVTYDSSDQLLTVGSATTTTDNSIEALATSPPDTAAGDPTGADVPVTNDDVDSVSGTVAGPNGQVNHGQVIKKLHELTDGNSGCLNSAVARSDMGKNDQEVDPLTIDVDCTDEKAPKDWKADAPDKADTSPGKSNEAEAKDKTETPTGGSGKSQDTTTEADTSPGKSEKAPGKKK